jgi:hypothetical protein
MRERVSEWRDVEQEVSHQRIYFQCRSLFKRFYHGICEFMWAIFHHGPLKQGHKNTDF